MVALHSGGNVGRRGKYIPDAAGWRLKSRAQRSVSLILSRSALDLMLSALLLRRCKCNRFSHWMEVMPAFVPAQDNGP
jgi:hypothetical protein